MLLCVSLILTFLLNDVKSENSPKIINFSDEKYEPTWESLDKRPIPQWYDQSKIGIFIHWGVFSVPSFGSEWFWKNWKDNDTDCVDYIRNNYEKDFSYQEFAKDFKAEFFQPKIWANLFKRSGAKYVVLTSKHHEGYTLWPSKYSFSWNAMDIGPHRDLIRELKLAVEDVGLTFGLYHSLYEWFNPMYLSDKSNNFTEKQFVESKLLPEMYELIKEYEPEVLWSDGDWEATDSYWESTEFLAWLYNESPVKETVVVNDRWGSGIPCKHGDFYTCSDRYNPGVLQPHKWENAMTLDSKSWGFRRNAPLSDYLTIDELLKTLAETISCGGNILINVGPTKEGIIAPIFEERLTQLGDWLNVNGEAIYETVPWKHQNDSLTSNVWYTYNSKTESIYAILLDWPRNYPNSVTLGSFREPPTDFAVQLLGNDDDSIIKWKMTQNGLQVDFNGFSSVKYAWVLKFSLQSKLINAVFNDTISSLEDLK